MRRLLTAVAAGLMLALPAAARAAPTHPAAHARPGLVAVATHPNLVTLHATPAAPDRATTFHLCLQGDQSKCIRSLGAGQFAEIDTSNWANLSEHGHGSAASFSNSGGLYLCEETNGVVSFQDPSVCGNTNQRAWWNPNASNQYNNVYHSSDWMITLTNNAGAEILAQAKAPGEWEAWVAK